jgi:DNA-binding protein H-NS
MKSTKFRKCSLNKLFEKRERELEALQLAATQGLYVELVALAQQMGITLRQLMQRSTVPGPLFYVNPENVSQQWRGRGAKPQWLIEWQAAGKSLDMVRM